MGNMSNTGVDPSIVTKVANVETAEMLGNAKSVSEPQNQSPIYTNLNNNIETLKDCFYIFLPVSALSARLQPYFFKSVPRRLSGCSARPATVRT